MTAMRTANDHVRATGIRLFTILPLGMVHEAAGLLLPVPWPLLYNERTGHSSKESSYRASSIGRSDRHKKNGGTADAMPPPSRPLRYFGEATLIVSFCMY
jgi:hypothetical protein